MHKTFKRPRRHFCIQDRLAVTFPCDLIGKLHPAHLHKHFQARLHCRRNDIELVFRNFNFLSRSEIKFLLIVRRMMRKENHIKLHAHCTSRRTPQIALSDGRRNRYFHEWMSAQQQARKQNSRSIIVQG